MKLSTFLSLALCGLAITQVSAMYVNDDLYTKKEATRIDLKFAEKAHEQAANSVLRCETSASFPYIGMCSKQTREFDAATAAYNKAVAANKEATANVERALALIR